jgi:hypothetical protein
MGWGVNIKNVYLNKVTKGNLEAELNEAESMVKFYRDKILTLMAATPRVIKDVEDNPTEWEDHIMFEMNDMWEDLEHYIIREYLCKVALNDLEEVENC